MSRGKSFVVNYELRINNYELFTLTFPFWKVGSKFITLFAKLHGF